MKRLKHDWQRFMDYVYRDPLGFITNACIVCMIEVIILGAMYPAFFSQPVQ